VSVAHPDTIAVHAGEPPSDGQDPPVTPPITLSSAAGYPDLETIEAAMVAHRGYGRWGTDNHRQLEAAVAALESFEVGGKVEALAVASGMAAIGIAILTEANAGDHVVAANDCYGTTLTFLRDDLPRFGITASFVDVQDLEQVRSAMTERTRVVICEICTNPLIRVPDLQGLASVVHQAGALLVADNTIPTPALFRPFGAGADVVVHSATKNLSGHADVIGGIVLGRPAWIEGARALVRTFGPSLGAFDAWLTLRGIRTLAVRMERHASNALALAGFLERHAAVQRVHYPMLESSPFYERTRRMMPSGAGALLSFELRGGRPAVDRLVKRLKLIRLMPSLGNVSTTISYPVATSHRGLAPDELLRAGITPGLVRCSAGLERIDDLVSDLEAAL